MIPAEEPMRRLVFARNRSCLLFGFSWSHHDGWPTRLTHVYLGWWVLTIKTQSGRS